MMPSTGRYIVNVGRYLTLLEYHQLRHAEERSWNREQLRLGAGTAFCDSVEPLLPRFAHKWSHDQYVHVERLPWFDGCLQLCELYGSAAETQRTWVRSRIDHSIGGKLGLFGLCAGVLAARERSTLLVRASLIAFAIADLAERDIRDVLIGVSLLCHCGTLAGADMPALFREVASLSGPAIGSLYREWASRYPNVARIGSMGWREVVTDEGVGFRTG